MIKLDYAGVIRPVRFLPLTWLLLLAACSTAPYEGGRLAGADFTQRAIVQQSGDITVSAAVPDAEETKALAGLDLYQQGIQPVWLKIENNTNRRARLALWSIDRDYFSPIEVAYMNRKSVGGKYYDDMQRWFYENGMPRYIEAGATTTGLVFTNLRPGTKGFNLTLFANRSAKDFTFFVPLPGFVADFTEVDFAGLYPPESLIDLDLDGLKSTLTDELPCCTTDVSGSKQGAPLNTVLIGTPKALRRSLLRGNWLETQATEEKTSRAREHFYAGRPPDGIFIQDRHDGEERIQLHLWLSHWRANDQPVWVGTVVYLNDAWSASHFLTLGESFEDTQLLQFFARESVAADMDSAQRFLLQNLWYSGSLVKTGVVRGMPGVSKDDPQMGFGGLTYFTDGYRMVAALSEEPVAIDEAEFVYSQRQIDASQEASQ